MRKATEHWPLVETIETAYAQGFLASNLLWLGRASNLVPRQKNTPMLTDHLSNLLSLS